MAMVTDEPSTAVSCGDEHVLIREDVGHIAVLTLNRPKARNSLSEGLMAALQEAPP